LSSGFWQLFRAGAQSAQTLRKNKERYAKVAGFERHVIRGLFSIIVIPNPLAPFASGVRDLLFAS
jgi:hypothetical protein